MESKNTNRHSRMDCTCALLRRASRQVTHVYDEALKPTGLRLSQYWLLAVIAREAPLTLSVLAEHLDMDRTTLTRNLGPLERAGWIVRTEGDDRRSRWVRLTRRGAAKLAEAKPHWASAERRVRARLGAEDLAGVHAAIDLVLVKLGRTAPAN